MLNIPTNCKVRVASNKELFSVLMALEEHGYRWADHQLPTNYAPSGTYGLSIYGKIIRRFASATGFNNNDMLVEIDASRIISGGWSPCTLQSIFALF